MQIFPFLCASICLLCNHPQKKNHQKGGLGGMLGKFLARSFNGWSVVMHGKGHSKELQALHSSGGKLAVLTMAMLKSSVSCRACYNK